MKKLLHKFHGDVRGAVVVFVTLLLIPAVLISGTGVDLTRVYAAKSILQDANQLAANSALASYDALLQDLYGLFGIMSEDEKLAGMINDYIEAAIFPKERQTGLGTFQLFYGSNLETSGLAPVANQNLADPDVLRRQIEEYAKFRAPVIIVTEIIDRLENFKKVQADADAIKDKMDIEDDLEDLEKIYKDIYDKINELNGYATFERNFLTNINGRIDEIQDEFEEMYNTRDSYNEAVLNEDDDAAGDYVTKYSGHIANIRALVDGGTVRSNFFMGYYDENGDYHPGGWTDSRNINYNRSVSGWLTNAETAVNGYKSQMDKLVDACASADGKKATIKSKVTALKQKLESGNCSPDLRDGMKPKLDEYEALVAYDLKPMAEAMRSVDTPLFDHMLNLIESMGYGDDSAGTMARSRFMSFSRLGSMSENGEFAIDPGPYSDNPDYLYEITSITPKKYSSPGVFKEFQSNDFDSTHNREFYEELQKLFGSENKSGKKSQVTKNVEKAANKIQEYFGSLLDFNPEGARRYVKGSSTDDAEDDWTSGDWGRSGVAKRQTKKAMDSSLITSLGNGLNNAGNKILLLTYDSEMFSCFTTNRREGDEPEVSMSGIPLGIDVNYFYQSELEYLFHGNEQSAVANLAAVTGMIFLVRFVLDYVASFSVDNVNYVVDLVKMSLAGLGPFATVAGELARFAMALGEAAIDTSRLKYGDYVALFKTNKTWVFTLDASKITGTMDDVIFSDSEASSSNDDDTGVTLCYKDYLRIFLLMVDDSTLAERTARLISLNVTNKKEDIGNKGNQAARESAMSEATLFDMSKAITDFSITTTVDLRMLFLSMPFAQRGVNGVVPPGTLHLSATDYRGY